VTALDKLVLEARYHRSNRRDRPFPLAALTRAADRSRPASPIGRGIQNQSNQRKDGADSLVSAGERAGVGHHSEEGNSMNFLLYWNTWEQIIFVLVVFSVVSVLGL
jgi:hypothetical protein